jgi:hypothetical protein
LVSFTLLVPSLCGSAFAAGGLSFRCHGRGAGAIDHGRAVETVVDVNVTSFLEAMGMGVPEDADDQRQRCEALSERLAGLGDGAVVPAGTILNLATLGSIEQSVGDAVSTRLESVLPRAVGGALPEAVDKLVLPAVARGVEQAIAGPPLTNYDGGSASPLSGERLPPAASALAQAKQDDRCFVEGEERQRLE